MVVLLNFFDLLYDLKYRLSFLEAHAFVYYSKTPQWTFLSFQDRYENT